MWDQKTEGVEMECGGIDGPEAGAQPGRIHFLTNIPPVPVRAAPRARVHSFSGYLADSELANDEDETDPEMILVSLEALATTLKLNERYEFALVDPSEIGLAL
ncbi:hypothetical protein C8R47DRAFT_1322495 [Mycena vitilis]|nr:hypothetical protein C8R47DRAFT_1322495 [Mycena vitilis]